MNNQNRIMFALVNHKQKLVLGSDGNFYKGLPEFGANYFCFVSHAAAAERADKVVSPKFEVISVSIDADGFPSAVTETEVTVKVIREMASQIVAYWRTTEGRKARRTEQEPFRAAVDHLFPGWESTQGFKNVRNIPKYWNYGMGANLLADAYLCLICATEEHPDY